MPSRLATPVEVTIAGAPVPAARVLSVHRSTGGASRDEATIQLDLSSRGLGTGYIENLAMQGQLGVPVTVTAFPGGAPQLIHSGVALVQGVKIAPEQEQLTITSRVEPWMFGVVMNGFYVWNPLSGALATILDEVVFNPEIDGSCLANQSSLPRLLGLSPVFLDPESCRTAEAETVQGDSPIFWTMRSAVVYLCWALNPTQQYVLNPVDFSLIPDDVPLQGFHLKRGKFLCDYLDELLPRYGLGWQLVLSSGAPVITFFVRGQGTANSVYLGSPGSFFSGDNALDSSVKYDVGNVRNQAVVYGDYRYVEATFTLQKGWPASLDTTPENELSLDSFSLGDTDDAEDSLRWVWRRFVLNEAGDYCGTRPEITAPYDLSGIFGQSTVPRRRNFLPCLTLDMDGAPIGITGGCQVSFSIDGGKTWKSIACLEDRSCQILQRECGIVFSGFFPPAELRRAGSSAQVRITCTVRSDVRLGIVYGPDGGSPLSAVAPFMVDESQKFHWRTIDPSSQNYSQVESGTLEADTCDDTDNLVAYATWLQNVFDIADVGGELTVEGLDTGGQGGAYDLGQVITAINGRAIDLNAQNASSGQQRYPQIVAIDYDPQTQRKVLHLSTYRDEGARR